MKAPGYDSPMLREQLNDTELMKVTEIGQDAVYNLIREREEQKAQLHKLYMIEMAIFTKVISFVFYLFLLFTAVMLGWMFFGVLWTLTACAVLTVLFYILRMILSRKKRAEIPKT